MTAAAPPFDFATRLGLRVAVLILFAVSGGLLWDVGYNYDGLTGSPVTKIHPFTYLVAALVFRRAFQFGRPFAYLTYISGRRPVAIAQALIAGALLVATTLEHGPGAAGLADTYIGPAMLALLLSEADEREFQALAWVLHATMAANALLALYEFATHSLLFPYRLDGVPFPLDFRPSALQGHALVNAAMTSVYLIALLAGGRSQSGGLRLTLVLLQSAALLVFGGRSALIAALLIGATYFIFAGFSILRRRRGSLLGASVALAALALGPAVIAFVLYSGYLDAIFNRFVDDGGSANTRVVMFELLRYFSLDELMFGPDLDYVDSLRRTYGLEQGIENPIVRLVLYQGGFITILLIGVLVLFFRELIRDRDYAVFWPILVMIPVLNASESIAVKTTILAKVVIILLTMFPPRQRRASLRPSASRIEPSNERLRSSISPIPSNRFQKAQGNR